MVPTNSVILGIFLLTSLCFVPIACQVTENHSNETEILYHDYIIGYNECEPGAPPQPRSCGEEYFYGYIGGHDRDLSCCSNDGTSAVGIGRAGGFHSSWFDSLSSQNQTGSCVAHGEMIAAILCYPNQGKYVDGNDNTSTLRVCLLSWQKLFDACGLPGGVILRG